MSESTEHTETKKQRRPGRVKRRLLRVFLPILLLVSLVQVGLYYFSEPFIKSYIEKAVKESSGGIYSVAYDDIHINAIGRGFEIVGLKVLLNKQLLDKFKADSLNYYEASFPNINIKGIGLLDLYNDKVLNISKVTLDNPKIESHGKKKKISNQEQEELRDKIYPFVSQYVKAITINELKFENASLDFLSKNKGDKSVSKAGDLAVTLLGFRIDQNSGKDSKRVLMSDDVKLELQDYRLNLSDGIHMLEAEQITLSTAESSIVGTKLWLLPNTSSGSTKYSKNTQLYDVFIPRVEITGADIYKAYYQRKFDIKHVLLENPEIKFTSKNSLTEKKSFSVKANLYNLIEKYLVRISINSFEVKDGKFSYSKNLKKHVPTIKTEKIDVVMRNFVVDSLSYLAKNKIFYSNDLDIDVGKFSLKLGDNIHHVIANSVQFSTSKSSVVAAGISLIAEDNNKKKARREGKELYAITIPTISMAGVNLKEAYNRKQLAFDKLLIENPKVDIQRFVTYNKSKKAKNTTTTLYGLFSDYLKKIAIKDIKLRGGSLVYTNHKGKKSDKITAKSIAFSLRNFRLDSATQYTNSRIFYADNVNFNLGNYVMRLSDDLHMMKVRNVRISTGKSQIVATGMELFPLPVKDRQAFLRKKGRATLFTIKMPSLVISGANIRRAYFYHLLNVNNILIDKPTVELNNYSNISKRKKAKKKINKDDLYALFEGYVKSINVKKLNLKDGVFNFVKNTRYNSNLLSKNNISIVANNFVLNAQSGSQQNRIFYSDDIDVKLKDYIINLPDSVHILKASEIGVSTKKSEIYLKSTRLYPKSKRLKSLRTAAFYDVNAPYILMNGVDINKLYKRGIFEINKITLTKPIIEIINQLQVKGKSTFVSNRKKTAMPANFKAIRIKEAVLNDGKLRLGNVGRTKKNIFLTTEINLNLQKFHLDSLNLNNSNKILYARNVAVDMDNYKLNLPDSVHVMSAKEISLSTGKKQLTVKNFKVSPRRKTGINKKMLFNMSFPSLAFDGFDIEKAYLQKNFTIRNATLKSPKIRLTSFVKPKKEKSNLSPIDVLENLLSAQLKVLNIRNLTFTNGSFSMFNKGTKQKNDLHFPRLYGKLTNFNLNKNSRKSDKRLFYADDLDLKIRNYSYHLPDSMYTMKIGEIGVSYAKRNIYFKSLKMIPRYGRHQFAKHLGYQTDRMDLKVDGFELTGFDFKKYLSKGEFKSNILTVNNLDVDIFHDKGLPERHKGNVKMPQQWLREFNPYFNFNNVRINGGRIRYEEFTKDKKSGFITFEKFDADANQITNDPVLWKAGKMMKIHFTARLYGKGRVNATFSSNIFDINNRFTLSGNIAAFNLTAINEMMESAANVSIKSGFNQNLDFKFTGDNKKSEGMMHFRYDDLKVSIFKKKKSGNSGLASFFANTFVINTKNKKENLRIGPIYYERDQKKSIFNFMWKSMLSGIKPSIGIKNKKKK